MTSLDSRVTYFKGFNALRFYAALSVVVQHVSYSPHDWFGAPLLPITLERLFLNGTDAVNLFFVLSGFLIIYLLLHEQATTGTVSIRSFYIRRAFRIYPVYFLYLFGVLLLLRPDYSPVLILLLIFFMGNVAFVLFFPFPPFDHLWSIGVEEQYYLLAPVIVRFKAYAPKIALAIVGIWWILLLIVEVLPRNEISAFVQMSRYDLIALGALTAYAFYHRWAIVRWIEKPLVLVIALALIGYAIVFALPSAGAFYTTILGLAYAVVIYHIAASEHVTSLLDNRPLEYLGKLSYSMYVYHPLFVLLFFVLLYERIDLVTYQIVAYPTIILLTIAVSWLSYEKLERPFLRFKNRFRGHQS